MQPSKVMKTYICPMHPEVRSNKPGRCPKCEMRLVDEGSKSEHSLHVDEEDKGLGKITWKSYLPLIVIIGLIFLTSLIISFKDYAFGNFSPASFISYFMAGFFVTFSGFKLMDLKGFAQGYSTYDLLAKRWFSYGYIYPFIELLFGLFMILKIQETTVLWAEFIVMTFSGLGVGVKLLKGEKFQCACLGTFLKVPLTYVTLIEDFGMAALAGILLFLR
jgi:hypothetical protein